jgi:hypothetical protein
MAADTSTGSPWLRDAIIRNYGASGNLVFTFSHIFIGMTNAAIIAMPAAVGLPTHRSNRFWTNCSPSLPRLARANARGANPAQACRAFRSSRTGSPGPTAEHPRHRYIRRRRAFRRRGWKASRAARSPIAGGFSTRSKIATDMHTTRRKSERLQDVGSGSGADAKLRNMDTTAAGGQDACRENHGETTGCQPQSLCMTRCLPCFIRGP